MAQGLIRGAQGAAGIQWTEAALTVAVTSGGSDTTAARPQKLTGGDWSAMPFATPQAALNAIPKGLDHDVIITIGAGTFAGFVAHGYVGKGRLRIAGSKALSTVTTGVNGGTAGAGTSTTSMNKPAAAANWTADDLRGKFLVITSGGGASGDSNFPTIRPIKSNTTTALSVDAVSGMDNTSVFEIVDVASIFTTASTQPYGVTTRFGFVNCTARIEATLFKATETGGWYGGLCWYSTSVTLDGMDLRASSGSAGTAISCNEITLQNSLLDGAWTPFSCNWTGANAIVIQASGQIDIQSAIRATVLADAKSCTGTAVKLRNIVNAICGLNANTCTATPLDLQNIHNFAIDTGLTGTNAGAPYGVVISKSGQYLMAGATLSGAADYQIEGSTGSWATLSSLGADASRGGNTIMHWGSGLVFMRGTFSIESDFNIGGTFKNFGLEAALDPATRTVAANAAGTQVAGTVVAYQETFVTAAGDNYSITMPYTTVNGGLDYQQLIFAAGYRGHIHNTSEYNIRIYPALVGPVASPTGTGTINGLAANAYFLLPAGCSVRWMSTGDNTYVMGQPIFATGYSATAAPGSYALDLQGDETSPTKALAHFEPFDADPSGASVLGDFVTRTTTGIWRICTTAGTPGTWENLLKGDVGATDNRVPRTSGTNGATLGSTGVTIDDADELYGYKAKQNTQTGTTYTLQASDTGKVIEFTNGSAVTVTLPDSLAVGFCCTIVQLGAGQVTLSVGGGAQLRNYDSHTKLAGQYAVGSLYVATNSGGSAAEYVFGGRTAA